MKVIYHEDKKSSFNVGKVREDFPIFQQQVNGHALVYFDNAATTQKPKSVIEAIKYFYECDNANVHRAVHELSARSTMAYEHARSNIAHALNAAAPEEIVFVRGTTEAINLVAQSYGKSELKAGDEVLLSMMEHHSNIVPWQLLRDQIGIVLKVIPINQAGEIVLEEVEKAITAKTKLISIAHASNALGTINPIKEIIALAHQKNITVVVDGAQAMPHLPVDVRELDCDFYAFSSHKMFGPTGIGVLYGKQALLEKMPPYQGGGDMIAKVMFEKTTYNQIPFRFEAGTPNISGVIGLSAAIDYVRQLGIDHIMRYEAELLSYAMNALKQIPEIELIGTASQRVPVISFLVKNIHAHDVGTFLDRYGIAVRTGHHCAMPLMDFYKVPSTVRVSLAFYNTTREIDALVVALSEMKRFFANG